jgi:hypothetical protein
MRRQLVLILFFCFALVGCSGGVEPDPLFGRIIVNKSIDGVEMGDDTTTVIQKLGHPSFIGYGDFPGVAFQYSEGVHAGLSLVIFDPFATPNGVTSISVLEPYQGRTSNGVGLGMDRNSVLARLGSPTDSSRTDAGQVNRYVFDKVVFHVWYTGNIVTSFGLLIKRNIVGGGADNKQNLRRY